MTEPITDEELAQLRTVLQEDADATLASFDPSDPQRGVRATADLTYWVRQCGLAAIARIDLERNRADEAEAQERTWLAVERDWKRRLHAAEAECERLRGVVPGLHAYRIEVEAAEPDLAAAYSLINGSSLPMDMQPMRARVLRTLGRVRALAAPPDPKEGK